MGAYQASAYKDNQESASSNNARSVGDCSSRGLSLQRKSITTRNNSNVMQRMAWMITRDLVLGFSGSSASSESLNNFEFDPTPAGSGSNFLYLSASSSGLPSEASALSGDTLGSVTNLGQSVSPAEYGVRNEQNLPGSSLLSEDRKDVKDGKKGKDLDTRYLKSNTRYLRFEHRHILFNHLQPLHFGGRGVKLGDNIGYGNGSEPSNHLYSEGDLSMYSVRNRLSNSDEEDVDVVNAINSEPCQNFGPYRLLSHNCQHWVNRVYELSKDFRKNRIAQEERERWNKLWPALREQRETMRSHHRNPML